MKVSVGMKDTYLRTVLDLATDSMEMINIPFEKEGEGRRKKEKEKKKEREQTEGEGEGKEGREETEFTCELKVLINLPF